MKNASERDLLSLIHNGGPEAEAARNALMRLNDEYITAVAKRHADDFGLTSDDAEEIAQNSKMNTLEALERFAHKSQLRTYIFRIVRFAAIDYVRKKRRSTEIVGSNSNESGDAALITRASTMQPHNDLETKIELQFALDMLPAMDRDIIIRRILNEEKLKDIAEDYNVSIQAIQKRIPKALILLRNFLEKNRE